MSVSANPATTHVLAVGVSTYEIGEEWRLPAAADHAVRFAEWASAAGVPSRQIHLFLSQRDVDSYKGRLDAINVQNKAATYTSFNEFVDKEMPRLSGDLLYFYWSGHGSISENSERILFYEDLTRDSQRHLDLNHFLIRLRSAPHGRFPFQIAYVDACANRFEDLGFHTSPGRDQPGTRALVSGVQQVFFLAADSGQQAAAGEFSSHVLRTLNSEFRLRGVWPPDPDEIVKEVRHQFRGLEQRPVQIAWRTSSGDESGVEITSGDLPAYDFINAVALSGGYSVRSLRRLASIVAQYEALGGERSEEQRDELYAHLAVKSIRVARKRRTRFNPQLDILHIIASAFHRGGRTYWITKLTGLNQMLQNFLLNSADFACSATYASKS